jgi:hypothetical protein
MKKFIFMAALMVGALTSQAATITVACTSSLVLPPTLGSTGNIPCPAFPVAAIGFGSGTIINSIRFVQTSDYSVNVEPGTLPLTSSTSITYSVNLPGTVFDFSSRVYTRGGAAYDSTITIPPAAYSDYLSNFDIALSLDNIIAAGGPPPTTTITSTTFDAAFIIDYTLPTQGDIPEPSSIALIGAGLIATGVMVRRKAA